jgi:23S rRNA (cytidine1920-2'-O)/16S rRNA (cytidine1409-2'-O)-methyltransferase
VAGEKRSSGKRVRADDALVAQGLAPSLERARALILAGEALAGDRPIAKAGDLIPALAALRLRHEQLPYVSRGGLKLAHALKTFGLDVTGLDALDVGASTGGFSDCLLQAGVGRVFCVDVGYGQLDAKVANDPRVTVFDRTNIRHFPVERLPARPTLAVIDVSFISLTQVLEPLARLLQPGATVVALVKPQFELPPERIAPGGIVRDEAARAESVRAVASHATALGYAVRGETVSPITGGKGNVEFLLWLRAPT